MPKELAEHHLNVDPKARPVKQSVRRMSDEKRKVRIVMLSAPTEEPEGDDPYAAYKIPDDLMW